jgi:hypothetical protein
MRNFSRPEMDSEGTKLFLLASVALAVQAFHENGKEWKLVGVRRQLPWRRVTQVSENCAALLPPALDGAEKGPRPQGLLTACLCHTFSTQLRGCLCSRLGVPVFVSFIATIVIRHSEVC